MLNRRRLLALLPSALAGIQAQAQFGFLRKPKSAPVSGFVYFGTDSAMAGAKGIYRSRFNAATGQLTPPELAAECSRPSFMALNQVHGRRLLYAVNEGKTAQDSAMETFEITPATGALRSLGKVSSGGAGPCFVSVDATGQSAYVANYESGTVASFHVLPDGRLTAPVDRVDFRKDARFGDHQPAPGPRKDRQDVSHPHSTIISPDNGFVVVNDLGQDAIAIFPLDPVSARLIAPTVVDSRVPGSGPRHVVFHPNGRWVYGVDELTNMIDQYLWTVEHAGPGRPAAASLTDTAHSVSTVSEGLTGVNTAAEITIDSGGRFVYASNRGVENTIVVFAVDPATGNLTFVQRMNCGGQGPRQFTLDPSQRWIVCGNQGGGSVTVFSRSAVDGKLSGPVQTVQLAYPMFVLFA